MKVVVGEAICEPPTTESVYDGHRQKATASRPSRIGCDSPFMIADPPVSSMCSAARGSRPNTVRGPALVVSFVQPAAAVAKGAASRRNEQRSLIVSLG